MMELALEKTDLSKVYPSYYKAKAAPQIVDVEESKFLTISGMGAPEDELFVNSIQAIYAVAYGVKKVYKQNDKDFVVPKLECFWWVESDIPFEETPRKEWFWELLIRMPEFVDVTKVDDAIKTVIAKKHLAQVNEVYLKKIHEGMSVQSLHIGSYDEEQETISRIFQFMETEGLEINGYHHEIYITDPMRTPVERLKTILRYGVKRSGN